MRAGGGSVKGGAFERLIARAISKHITEGEDDSQLIRSRSSGGWVRGHRAKQNWRQLGDLAPNGPEGDRFCQHFVTECKDRKGVDFYHVWTKSPSQSWIDWWMQVVVAANKSKRKPCPLLVMHTIRRPTLAVMPTPFAVLIGSFKQQIVIPEWHVTVISFEDWLLGDTEEYYTASRQSRHLTWELLHGLLETWPDLGKKKGRK